jgi:hypothetical protein
MNMVREEEEEGGGGEEEKCTSAKNKTLIMQTH